jgi:TrmH family RNA methyltransferase
VNPNEELITSPQNQHLQLVRALLEQPKARRKHHAFVAEGARLLEDGLDSELPVQFVLYKPEHSPRVDNALRLLPPTVPLMLVESRLFDHLSDTETSQGVLAVFSLPTWEVNTENDFLLILDQVRDPGNLGTILRTAEAAGVQAVLLTPGTTDAWSPKVVRASMGSHFRLPIFSLDWETINTVVSDFQVLHADMEGELAYWQADLCKPTALLIGGEADGISQEAQRIVTGSVRIPMAGENESLNAAISAGILLFEVLRQRSV